MKSRHTRKNNRLALAALIVVVSALLAACNSGDRLAEIRKAGVLTVITRNGPTTYYEDRNGPTGFEYVLAERFAEHLGVELKVQVDYGIEDIFTSLERGRADLAAAGLTITPERRQRLWFSEPYMDIEQWVLFRAGRQAPENLDDVLESRIRVIANSAHAEWLSNIQHKYPRLSWIGSRDVETVDLLDQVADGEIDYTIIDSNEYIANRGFYPRVKKAFTVGEPGQLAWVVAKREDNERLLQAMNEFFIEIKTSGELDQLIERFYSHSEDNTQSGSRYFQSKVEHKLPRYRKLIEQVAEEYQLEWQLLAAISYQESHWNPRARSPTGVRGFMMLTLPTAEEMGVKSRLSTEQSLRGGARYFKKIHQRIDDEVTEPDRSWMALAAYNVGLGHLNDARKIARQLGRDPNKWADMKEVLPLLRKKKWYKNTRYGYARGDEPVTYVQNIRHYYNLLTWSDVASTRTPPPTDMDQYVPEDLKRGMDAL